MKPSIIRHALVNIDELFKPMCANCTHYLKDISSKEHIIRSRCKKFFMKPPKDMKIKEDYKEIHPYAILARFDRTFCGINGTYFEPVNK